MNILAKHPERWQAANTLKALRGAVAYEFAMVDGAPKELPFNPRVEFWEECEPSPWVVVLP